MHRAFVKTIAMLLFSSLFAFTAEGQMQKETSLCDPVLRSYDLVSRTLISTQERLMVWCSHSEENILLEFYPAYARFSIGYHTPLKNVILYFFPFLESYCTLCGLLLRFAETFCPLPFLVLRIILKVIPLDKVPQLFSGLLTMLLGGSNEHR